MNPIRIALLVGAAIGAVSPVSSQDLIGVAWSGAVVRIDSRSGGVVPVGNGLAGLNCLARAANGTFYGVQRVASTFHTLVAVDPDTGAGTVVSSCADIRGLSQGPGNLLFGIRDGMYGDTLVTIDPINGVYMTLGNTGFDGIQGLALHQGVLYAWDVLEGLLVVDPQTGVATDPFPGDIVPQYLQSLCSHPDGRLLVGGGDSSGPDTLYVVDLGNGAAMPIGTMTGVLDVRGIEALGAYVTPYGQGCDGVYGPVQLAVSGVPQAGHWLTSTSGNHQANAVGMIVFGVNAVDFDGVPLPVLLDPLFGTNGCSLYTSLDGSFVMVAGPAAPATMQFAFPVPAAASGAFVVLQHVCLEAVPGGMSWSNAVAIRIG